MSYPRKLLNRPAPRQHGRAILDAPGTFLESLMLQPTAKAWPAHPAMVGVDARGLDTDALTAMTLAVYGCLVRHLTEWGRHREYGESRLVYE